jgi:dimethylargininase
MIGATRALVRGIPAQFPQATTRRGPPVPPIDLALARAQHDAYVQALETHLGLQVIRLPTDDALPDSCFVEDVLVVAEGRGLVTRSAHPGRRAEAEPVLDCLLAMGAGLELVRMAPPAVLDGGDVLRVGTTLYASRSRRTSADGLEVLRRTFAPVGLTVEEVELPPGVLHLKSVCSSPAPGLVLLAQGSLHPDLFDARVLMVPRVETDAANVLGHGKRALLPAGFPDTRRLLADAGLEARTLDLSEIRKADGAVTCLSVLF